MGRFYWSIRSNRWGNAIEFCAPSGPQRHITSASDGLHNHSKLLTMVKHVKEKKNNHAFRCFVLFVETIYPERPTNHQP